MVKKQDAWLIFVVGAVCMLIGIPLGPFVYSPGLAFLIFGSSQIASIEGNDKLNKKLDQLLENSKTNDKISCKLEQEQIS